MEKKKKKIGITAMLVIAPVLACLIAGVSIAVVKPIKPVIPETVKTISVGDIQPISLTKGETYTSDKIEVKCFSDEEKTKEIQPETKPELFLLDDSYKTVQYSWISINDNNQIVIDKNASSGNYVFYVVASCKKSAVDEEVITDHKQVNVEVKTPIKVIDRITMDGFVDTKFRYLSSCTLTLTLRAWSGNEEVEFPTERKLMTYFWAKDTSPAGHIMPSFNWKQEGNKITLNMVTNQYWGYPTVYDNFTRIFFEDDESIEYTQTAKLTVFEDTPVQNKQ